MEPLFKIIAIIWRLWDSF